MAPRVRATQAEQGVSEVAVAVVPELRARPARPRPTATEAMAAMVQRAASQVPASTTQAVAVECARAAAPLEVLEVRAVVGMARAVATPMTTPLELRTRAVAAVAQTAVRRAVRA